MFVALILLVIVFFGWRYNDLPGDQALLYIAVALLCFAIFKFFGVDPLWLYVPYGLLTTIACLHVFGHGIDVPRFPFGGFR